MKAIVFSHPKETLPVRTLLPDKRQLFTKLNERGLEGFVTLDGEAAFKSESVEVHKLIDDRATRVIGELARTDVHAVVNRLDRSIKLDRMPREWNEADIPVVNKNTLRSLVFRKHRVQDEVLAPLGLGIPGQLIEVPFDAITFAEQHPAEAYIAKPTSGTFSKGIDRLHPVQIAEYFQRVDKLGGTMLLQPAYDFAHPLPSSIKPYDKSSQEDFERWAKSDAIKELRMYGFLSPAGVDVFPVGRAMSQNEDHWFFMDPESVPEHLYANTRQVLDTAARQTGSRAVYAALDIAYGNSSKDDRPDYHVVELNGRMPYLVGYDKHPGVADILREKFADQLMNLTELT